MNADIEYIVKNSSMCLGFQQTQLKHYIILYKIPGKSSEVIGTNLYTIKDNNFLSVVDDHSKHPSSKQKTSQQEVYSHVVK